jgi:hypothetical protein
MYTLSPRSVLVAPDCMMKGVRAIHAATPLAPVEGGENVVPFPCCQQSRLCHPCRLCYRLVVAQPPFLGHPVRVGCDKLHAREVGKRRCAATGHSMQTTAARTSLALATGSGAGIGGICV